jgi:hypothetical protein
MSENQQTKDCPLCAETIKAVAKVCPHCRHWQKQWSLQNSQVGATLWVLVCLAALVGTGAFVEKLFGPKEAFATYRDEISIVGSQMSHRVSGSNLMVTVVGTLTNRSIIGWKDVGIEVQFLDKSGKLIDAFTVNADSYRGVSILPHGEAAFKIEGKATRPESYYNNYRTLVRWAKDVDAWP